MNKIRKHSYLWLLAVALITVSAIGCTANQRAKNFGGKQTINVPAGEKIIDVTWKDDSIWYATRPMRDDEQPETVSFHQESSFGVFEGSVTFVESR